MKIAPFSLVVYLVLWCSASIHGQASDSISYKDSLQQALSNSLTDSTRVQVMSLLGYELLYSEPEEAREYIDQAIRLAKESKLSRGIAKGESLLGIYFQDRAEHDSALFYHHRVLTYLREDEDAQMILRTYSNIAQVYQQRNSFPQALEYYQKAQTLADSVGTEKDKGGSDNNLASYHIELGNFQMDVNNDSIALYSEFKAAEPYLQQAMEHYKKAGYERGVALVLGNLSLITNELGDLNLSLEYLLQSIEYFERLGNKMYATIAYNSAAITYTDLGNLEKAEQYAMLTLKNAKELDSPIDIRNAYGRMVVINETRGDYKQALYYNHLYSDVVRQIVNEDNQQQINILEQEFKVAEQEQKIAIMRQQETLKDLELSRKNAMLVFAFAGSLLLIAFVLLLFRSNQLRQRTNKELLIRHKELEEKNEIIARNGELLTEQKDLIEEKNREITERNIRLKELYDDQRHMIGVVAHDLRAPLSKIRGLTDILTFNQEQNQENHNIIQRINDLTKSGTQLITDLTSLTVFEAKGIEINWQKIDLNQLLAKIVQGHLRHAKNKHIHLEFSPASETEHIQTDPFLLTRVIDNLISNALKFSENHQKVWVSWQKIAETWQIQVKDEGPGISKVDQEKIFQKYSKLSARPTAGESSTGLGLSIVKLLVEHLGGSIRVNTVLGSGSSFIVTFPKVCMESNLVLETKELQVASENKAQVS